MPATLDLDSSSDEDVQHVLHQSLRLTQQGLNMAHGTVTAHGLGRILAQLKERLEAANALILMHNNHMQHAGAPENDETIDIEAMERD